MLKTRITSNKFLDGCFIVEFLLNDIMRLMTTI